MDELDRQFHSFAKGQELRDRRPLLIKQHAEQSSKALKKVGLEVQGFDIIGSYERGTMNPPLTSGNVDVLVRIDAVKHRQWQNPEATHHVMRIVSEALGRHYHKYKMHGSGIETAVQLPDFRLDVIVAMPWHTGSFLTPDPHQEKWIYIDPAGFAARLNGLNSRHNGMLIPLIKLIRAWNQSVDKPLNGFHLECLVMRRYEGTGRLGVVMQSFPAAVCDFFTALPTMLEHPCLDPVLNQRVDSYLDEGPHGLIRDRAIDKASAASNLAGTAYDLIYQNRAAEAHALWGQLLGQKFLTHA